MRIDGGFYAMVALLSGAALAMQVGFNTELRARLGGPILAALVSFGVGTACLLAYAAWLRPAWPDRAELARMPWWGWLGGVVGACYVASAAAFASRLGAAGWLGLIVTGQILTSLALDHFGLIGFPRRPVDLTRALGAALLLAGVVLVLGSRPR